MDTFKQHNGYNGPIVLKTPIACQLAPCLNNNKVQAKNGDREKLLAIGSEPEQMKLAYIRTRHRDNSAGGFSIVELVVVVVLIMLIAAIAIPQAIAMQRALRATSDARSLASQLALVKMRAANAFTQSRLNCDVSARSCQLEVCTSKGASSCNTFSPDGGPILLSQNINFGFGSITTPAGTQTTIQNTPQILFNSRSIPVDNTGVPTGNYALYITGQTGNTYAVTVSPTGRVAAWQYSGGGWRSL